MADKEQGNIKQEYTNATVGLNLDQSLNQIKKGSLTYALNATVENFDANSFSYGNEEGNEFCLSFPEGFVLIGTHFIPEKNKHIFMLTNPSTGDSQIGYMDNNDCTYKIYIDDSCLGFDINYPIHKIVHKVTNCSTEIYWADNVARRYLNLDDIPYLMKYGSNFCSPVYTNMVDCNQLKIQPNFSVPILEVVDIVNGGNLTAGTVQFAIQYSDSASNPYTSYYSITNPTPIADPQITSVNFNYPVGKSVVIDVSNLDSTGQFQYFNLAVIKTINAITSVELIGTYYIDSVSQQITYTGQGVENIKLTINDIFEKFPYYDLANDITNTEDVLIWSDLTSIDRVNYQNIANQITLQWETWRIPANENYANELNATNFRSFLRDEIYPFEICFLLSNGKETDSFHIPGRIKNTNENIADVPDTNQDFIGTPDYTSGGVGYSPYWKIYNTASVTGFTPEYLNTSLYKGSYQYGEFAYWESLEEYPCNTEIWGELAGQKIRHHKFPDVLVSPIFESKLFISPDSMVMGNDAIFPIGVKIDSQQIQSIIISSSLSSDQKSSIIGFKILRGDRSTNKSIVAKGILRNVGTYEREGEKFYYPNYPYNDLTEDPFLNFANNAYEQLCESYEITISQLVPDPFGTADYADVQYTNCNTNKQNVKRITEIGISEQCSTSRPVITSPAIGTIGLSTYEEWYIDNSTGVFGVRFGWVDPIDGYSEKQLNGMFEPPYSRVATIHVVVGTNGPQKIGTGGVLNATLFNTHYPDQLCGGNTILPSIENSDDSIKYRQIFNSPETSFGQPFLGTILKLENVIFGKGNAHFAEVKNNAKYKLISEEVQRLALKSSEDIADADITAMFTAYQAYLTIYINGITRRNYAYSFNSIADYNYSAPIGNNLGIKQRTLDLARYLIPGVQSIGNAIDDYSINNYQRESSVFLKTDVTKTPLPFPDKTQSLLNGAISIIKDDSRFTISEKGLCSAPATKEDISVVSYYASLKNNIVNQWGQIYSYETIDTGFQKIFGINSEDVVFGGDTFISRFAFKTKLPFFIDNRVNAPDDSDVFYDELGNIAYPKYWHSARSILKDYMSSSGLLSNIISYKAHNFDCPNDVIYPSTIINSSTTTTSTTIIANVIDSFTVNYYDGYFYLFAYGIPNFYCESSYNTDLRQAFNNKEGDFWPHVSSGIPDDWEQESFVSIANDNTYYYNTTFSKQNKENTFTHLPIDWNKICYTNYPFRTIYSEPQNIDADNRVNAWLIYRAISYFDFPQNYGKLISLDGIQNKAILVRFENKSLIYNNLLTMDTSNPQAAYLGSPILFKGAPPIDFAETDLGYVGSQHKMLLKIPQGQVTIDAKRGQVFLIQGTQAKDLCAPGSGMNRFFTDHLAFEILRWFPNMDIDNNFNGMGLHGVYDSKYDRVIITKLDYIPLEENIKYDEQTKEFYLETTIDTDTITTTSTMNSECEFEVNIDIITTTTTTTTLQIISSTTTSTTVLPTTTSTTTTTTEISTTTTTTTFDGTTTTTTTTIVEGLGYGALYNWYAVTDERNIAPVGFHVPSKTEWETLVIFLGGGEVSNNKLREEGTVHWNSPNTGATNEVGFNGVGSGARYNDGFYLIKTMAQLWSTTPLDYEFVWYLYSINGYNYYDTSYPNGVMEDNYYWAGLSLRFIADSGSPTSVTDNSGHVYPCVTIGTQTWTAANSNETKYQNGDWIHGYEGGVYIPVSNEDWTTSITEGMCYYNDDINNG